MGPVPTSTDVAKQDGPSTVGRFLVGIGIGIVALGAALAIDASAHLGMAPLAICLALGGMLAAFSRGVVMLVGVAVGVPLPVLFMTLATSSTCGSGTSAFVPFPLCGQGFGFALAALLLVGGPVAEVPGFVLGRFVRWALSEPEGG